MLILSKRLTGTVLLGLCFFAIFAIQARSQAQTINSFETTTELSRVRAFNANTLSTRTGATYGKRALQVTCQCCSFPSILILLPTPLDFSKGGGLAMDITNPGSATLKFGVRIDDSNGGQRYRETCLQPGVRATFRFTIPGASTPDPTPFGMKNLPHPYSGMRTYATWASGSFDPSRIVRIWLYMRSPDTPTTFLLDYVRLLAGYSTNALLTGGVDAFGQYTKTSWPGKLTNASEFAQRRAQEETALAQAPTLPDRDQYGGWTGGPTLPTAGSFRTLKLNNQWWLVTPDGHLFFSMGINNVALGSGATVVTGREKMFAQLPAQSDPLAAQYGTVNTHNVWSGPVTKGISFNFAGANAQRKYGATYQTDWLASAQNRLRAWGFNTIGNWSDTTLYRNSHVPYVACGVSDGTCAHVSSGLDYWGKMPDPFDPLFAKQLTTSLTALSAQVKGDPWCLGYYIDNELSWTGSGTNANVGLACGALALNAAKSPAKQAFLAQLRAQYTDIAALNTAWNTSFSGWNALKPAWNAPSTLPDAMKADMTAFVLAFARQYFTTVRNTLKSLDPDHLYLGCRFSWYTPEVVQAAKENCDVISFNYYASRLETADWDFLNALDVPCIISEFHSGATDRGMFGCGLVEAWDQDTRAGMYQDYVRSVLDNPMFVGCHWFQYQDEAFTGRLWDGSNSNLGFIDVTDTPYPEMVKAAQAVHLESYGRRYNNP